MPGVLRRVSSKLRTLLRRRTRRSNNRRNRGKCANNNETKDDPVVASGRTTTNNEPTTAAGQQEDILDVVVAVAAKAGSDIRNEIPFPRPTSVDTALSAFTISGGDERENSITGGRTSDTSTISTATTTSTTTTMRRVGSKDVLTSAGTSKWTEELHATVLSEIRVRRAIQPRPPINVDESYEAPVYPKTPQQMDFLLNVLSSNFLFEDMSLDECQTFMSAMKRDHYEPGTPIINQGCSQANFFYVVETGTVDFIKDQKHYVGQCTKGGTFGELALLYDSPRAVSCVASHEECGVDVWKVDQYTFRRLMMKNTNEKHEHIQHALRKISIFQHLPSSILSKIEYSLVSKKWKAGDRIIEKGDVGDTLYVITEGQVRVHDVGFGDSQHQDSVLSVDDWFGECALLTGEPCSSNFTAITDMTTLMMDEVTFENCIGHIRDVIDREARKKALLHVPSIAKASEVTPHEIEQLVDLMTEERFEKGHIFTVAGQPHEPAALYILRKGWIQTSCPYKGLLFTLKVGDYFGDTSIVASDPEQVKSQHTSVGEEDIVAWVLRREDVVSVFSDDISRLGEVESFSRQKTHNVDGSTSWSLLPRHARIPFDNIQRRRMLGRGAFGKVWLVSVDGRDKQVHNDQSSDNEETDTELFALKVISKRKLLNGKQVHLVLREKELLSQLNHPFIMNLVDSYQGEKNLYLLLPFLQGGELFRVLKEQKHDGRGITNDHAAFYAACIIEAIGHLHQRWIAYRDLKLENILIDDDGYCKVIDFGLAKIVYDKTYTLVGTPDYLAPEVIMSKGHDKAVDYWAYGVLIYELLVGRSPFNVHGSSQLSMMKRIVLLKYDIPDYVSPSAKSLIESLLVRKQSLRLGNLAKGYVDIKRHEWFTKSNINDFCKIMRKEVCAPWKPNVNKQAPGLDGSDQSNMAAQEEDTAGTDLTEEEQKLFDGF